MSSLFLQLLAQVQIFFPLYSTIGFTIVFKAAFYVKASFDPFKCLILKKIRPVDVAH